MFSHLSERLSGVFQKIRGHGRLTDDNIQDSLREVRISLLEADVALEVAKQFLERVKADVLGKDVLNSINPGQAFIKCVNDELVRTLGDQATELNLSEHKPIILLLAGLQGSGKTTSAAKLARLLKTEHKKTVLLASTDVYRPAAIDQLHDLAKQMDIDCMPVDLKQSVPDIAKQAKKLANTKGYDVLIVDTAGRSHIDETMMQEMQEIATVLEPHELLFVVDSMSGQDAVNAAKSFGDALSLTGVILTKADGDARGGAALSVKTITGKPIKYIGVGEKVDAFEVFHPKRIASRILGMGDIVGLVEEAERKIGKQRTEKLAKKLSKGKGFTLLDYKKQLEQISQMGGMADIVNKLPAGMAKMAKVPSQLSGLGDDKIKSVTAIINSMTKQERLHYKIVDGSRKRRIAKGAGVEIPQVNKMLKDFEKMQKMMKKMSKPGAMQKALRGMQGFM